MWKHIILYHTKCCNHNTEHKFFSSLWNLLSNNFVKTNSVSFVNDRFYPDAWYMKINSILDMRKAVSCCFTFLFDVSVCVCLEWVKSLMDSFFSQNCLHQSTPVVMNLTVIIIYSFFSLKNIYWMTTLGSLNNNIGLVFEQTKSKLRINSVTIRKF